MRSVTCTLKVQHLINLLYLTPQVYMHLYKIKAFMFGEIKNQELRDSYGGTTNGQKKYCPLNKPA